MTVTTALVSIVVLLGVVAVWRLIRWRYRPSLELDTTLQSNGDLFTLAVRNTGAAVAARCRGRLIRVSRDTQGDWTRMDPDSSIFPLHWPDGSPEHDLSAGEESELVIARRNRLAPGHYRIEMAVINGEEKRTLIEFEVPPDQGVRRENPAPGRDAREGNDDGTH